MDSSRRVEPHAIVVSCSGQGHINPCMLLSRSLAAMGFHVSFICFSSYSGQLQQMNRSLLPDPADLAGRVSGRICVHVLDDGLEHRDLDKPFLSNSTMKESLLTFINGKQEMDVGRPTCIVSEPFAPWTLEVAQRAGIPRVEFHSSNALAYLVMTNLVHLYSEGIYPEKGSPTKWTAENPVMLDHIPGFPPFRSEIMPAELRFNDASHPLVKLITEIESCSKHSERVLIHSFIDIEPTAFKALELQGVKAYDVGPLPDPGKKTSSSKAECISWLDSQGDHSVIYIAFGSISTLSVEEMQELALGLEGSGCPFMWVIRKDNQKEKDLSQILPEGFLERTKGRGMIISWAPQVEVLSHRAVGGFLSHCGWNSTLESLQAGVPMLCCPRIAEQRLNCYYVCEQWNAGVEMMRTDIGGLEKKYVETGIKALLYGEEGLQARDNAQRIMELAKKSHKEGGHAVANLQRFYDDMRALCSMSHSP
ncbi:hypothetical protein KP509_29G011400 [Ceratopteris richardii]|uniref:Glycosyltransferase n=2 Tax=Ceratopteris richardii TaxID=49495 RepID=A0A8T2R6F6_CERRI|nr:hypothetical protein KP509_29G011400 [Ceratopteris richardii]